MSSDPIGLNQLLPPALIRIKEITASFSQSTKDKSKAEIREECLKLCTCITAELIEIAKQCSMKGGELYAKVKTMEWYFQEKVESHARVLLEKDKEIQMLKDKLAKHKKKK